MKFQEYINEKTIEIYNKTRRKWIIIDMKGKKKDMFVYNYIRNKHKFLTDDNHTWEVKENVIVKFGGKTTKHNFIYINKTDGKKWFTEEYRL